MLGLPGIAARRAEAYARAGWGTRRQLLYHLPQRFAVRPAAVSLDEVEAGGKAALVGTVQSTSLRRRGRRSTVTLRLAADPPGGPVDPGAAAGSGSGADAKAAGTDDGPPRESFRVLLFNRAYLARSLKRGTRLWVAGRVEVDEESEPRVRLLASDYERLEDPTATAPPASIVPRYRLPPGVPPRVHRKAVAAVLDDEPLEDWRDVVDLPAADGAGLSDADRAALALPLAEVFASIHRPPSVEAARAARRRLAWDEAFALGLESAARRQAAEADPTVALPLDDARHARLLARLPHDPTPAQARVIEELREDLSGAAGRPMARLLQGDVGSGKTLVALYAMLAAVAAGRQAALMAPTEILAEQHAATLRATLAAAFGDGAPEVALVTGRGTAAERRAAREACASGRAALAVGTHGLSTAGTRFADLAVTVVDEQHRFGVRQRARFREKGGASHLLVMTATPIPRTLALTAYGDLDVSIIDALPPGRSPRRTEAVPRGRQPALWKQLAGAVARGERGYVVCPSIAAAGARVVAEDDEADADADEVIGHSVAETLERVRAALGPGARVAAVHGRLPPDERDAVLEGFRAGRVDVLVATVLVEVGLDVPEATFVVVPDPSRFGLAQLHQIRGRVGRGAEPGRCYLLGPVAAGPARARVKALVASEDGFELAERDLELRGPGEVLGTRQSGVAPFHVLDPVADVALLAAARGQARAAVERLGADGVAALRRVAFPLAPPGVGDLLAGG